jgi:hypothetical protein
MGHGFPGPPGRKLLERIEQPAVESSELKVDLAEDQEPLVGGKSDFVVAVQETGG